MSDDQDTWEWAELQEAFESFVELSPEEQAQRIDALASTNPGLSRRLAKLLAADARAESLLEPLELLSGPGPAAAGPPDPFGLIGRTVSHFRVLDALGAGGMGVVYRAEDVRLNRMVALKFLLPQYSLDAAARERFLREARAASALDHPNVCTVHEAGESEEGQPFLAMSCYGGETLRARLAGGEPMPVQEALEIARQVLLGLGAAHAAGIVHRDLKPGNLMLTPDGSVKILDFGLAKVRDLHLTDPEQRPGTAAYMSPEQLRGEPLDARSDLWSLGVVLYEMLAGRTPFGRGHALSTVYSILNEEPAPPSAVRAGVPEALDRITARLLHKHAEARFASAADVLADLGTALGDPAAAPPVEARRGDVAIAPARRAGESSPSQDPRRSPRRGQRAAVAVALTLLTVVGVALVRDTGRALDEHRVFVAPLENLTGDAALDPLGRMAADWLTQGLAQSGVAEVVPTLAPFGLPEDGGSAGTQPRARRRAIEAHARDAGAGTLVQGSYYRQDDSVLVQVQVADVRTGRVVGGIPTVGARVDRPLDAAEALRRHVIAALAARFDKTVASLAEVSSQPPSLEAHEEYSDGVESFLRSDYAVALRHFDRAVALDSGFAMATIWGVFARLNLGRHAEADSITQRLLPRRQQLPPFDRTMLDALSATFAGDLAAQARATRAGAELAPGSFGQYAAGFYALRINRPREAIALLSRVDPDRADHRGWIWYWDVLTSAHHMLGEHRHELKAARAARRRYPDRQLAAFWEARALAALGRTAEVEALVAGLSDLRPSPMVSPASAVVQLAEELAAHGRHAASDRLIRRVVAAYEDTPVEARAQAGARAAQGLALYRLGSYREARELFATLAAEDPGNVDYVGYLGVIAAREGDIEAAGRASARLAGLNRPYLFGTHTFWRARIAALLGDRREAIRLLQAAFAEGRAYGPGWHSEPDLEALRSDAAFRQVLRPDG